MRDEKRCARFPVLNAEVQESNTHRTRRGPLAKGGRIALLDLDAADLASCSLHETESVAQAFGQSNNSYCIPKHHPRIAARIGLNAASPEAALPHFLHITFPTGGEGREAPATEQHVGNAWLGGIGCRAPFGVNSQDGR